jgi:hypothetical protein
VDATARFPQSMSEFGQHTRGGVAEHAAGAGPAFVYTTRDRNTGSGNPQDNYGVYRTDWTPKPAADVIKSLARPG